MGNKEETEEQYRLLVKQIDGLIDQSNPLVTNLANIVAALKQTFSKISWVGFYLLKGDQLYLAPFQGKVACTKIKIGRGVCGTSAKTKQTVIVPNVHEYPGHIACDAESNSEIVVPIMTEFKVYGVLDLDSTAFSAFTDIDKVWLEQICEIISKKLNLTNSILV